MRFASETTKTENTHFLVSRSDKEETYTHSPETSTNELDAAVAVKLQFGLTEIDHCMMSLKRHCLDMKALSGGWVDCVELAQMGN